MLPGKIVLIRLVDKRVGKGLVKKYTGGGVGRR